MIKKKCTKLRCPKKKVFCRKVGGGQNLADTSGTIRCFFMPSLRYFSPISFIVKNFIFKHWN